MNNDYLTGNGYLKGSTVYLMVRVDEPGTRDPAVGVSVVLQKLALGSTDVTPGDTAFTFLGPGLFRMAIETADLEPGLYDWVIAISDVLHTSTIAQDSFTVLATA